MEYKTSLKGLFFFEIKSWLGRRFFNSKPKLKNEKNYLNLGCGSNYIDGYINADFFYHFKFWKKNTRKLEWQLDLRYPLDCKNEVFDGIFMEHTIEHLYPDDAKKLLKELYRTLKIGAIIRITVPDIEKYINYYTGEHNKIDINKFENLYKTGCSAIRNVTQNYFHLSTYDFEELRNILDDIGFINVQKMEFEKSQDRKLILDIKERSWETLYIEATK